MPCQCRVSRVSRGQSSWPKGPKKSGRELFQSRLAAIREGPVSRKKRQGEKGRLTRESHCVPQKRPCPSFIVLKNQKMTKEKKSRSHDPMIPYAMQCKKRQINITETDKFRDRMKTKVLEMS